MKPTAEQFALMRAANAASLEGFTHLAAALAELLKRSLA